MTNAIYQSSNNTYSNGNSNNFNQRLEVTRGDIVLVNFGDHKDSIQGGLRPAICVANNAACRYSPVIHVVPITSAKKPMPTHVTVPTTYGVDKDSIALCEQQQLINKKNIQGKIGCCDSMLMDQIDKALKIQLNLQEQIEPINIERINKWLYLINEATTKYEKYEDEYFIESRDFNREQLRQYCERYKISFERIMEKRIIQSIYINRNGVIINGV